MPRTVKDEPPDLADMVVIRQVRDYARSKGVDPEPLLEHVGIDPADVDVPDTYVDAEQWYRFQVELAGVLKDPLLGLRLTEYIGVKEGYGLPGALFALATSGRGALEMLVRILPKFLPRTTFRAEPEGDVMRVTVSLDYPDELTWAHRQEMIGGMRQNTQVLAGASFTPRAVRLRQREGDAAALRAFFGVDVELGADVDEIELPMEAMTRPSPTADPVLLRHLEDAIEVQLERRRAWEIGRAHV